MIHSLECLWERQSGCVVFDELGDIVVEVEEGRKGCKRKDRRMGRGRKEGRKEGWEGVEAEGMKEAKGRRKKGWEGW